MNKVKVGLLGYGTVGQGVIKILRENESEIKDKLGAKLEICAVADLDVKTPRQVKVKKDILFTDPYKIINDPDIPIVIELIGDWPGVKKLITDALAAGKSVVTANKALIAKHGDELVRAAVKHGQDLYYEAAVCGTIPVIRALREGLAANRIESIFGIVNGTCNYILTEMSRGNGDYPDILEKAQEKGYAEAKPEADVEGCDAAHKLAILIRLGFGVPARLHQIYREGITRVSASDISAAGQLGYVIKLLAIAKRRGRSIEARVHPTLIPEDHPLAAVTGVYNAVYVAGNFAGPTLFYGKGAGREPTAAAVAGDVMELARGILRGDPPRRLPFGAFTDGHESRLSMLPMKEVECEYYLRMRVTDRPGVLSRVSGILGDNKISISSVVQHGRHGPQAEIVIITHRASEARVQNAMAGLNRLRLIKGKVRMIRIETDL